MVLIQLLLPLYTPRGAALSSALIQQVQGELTDTFGGSTAYIQTPANGFWKTSKKRVERDRVILIEVVVPRIRRSWWKQFHGTLRSRFHQEDIHMRALPLRPLL